MIDVTNQGLSNIRTNLDILNNGMIKLKEEEKISGNEVQFSIADVEHLSFPANMGIVKSSLVMNNENPILRIDNNQPKEKLEVPGSTLMIRNQGRYS